MRWFSPSPQPSVEGPTEHPACLAVPYNGNSFLTSLQANCQPRVLHVKCSYRNDVGVRCEARHPEVLSSSCPGCSQTIGEVSADGRDQERALEVKV